MGIFSHKPVWARRQISSVTFHNRPDFTQKSSRKVFVKVKIKITSNSDLPSHLWFIKSLKMSRFPVINAKSRGVNPSLFVWSNCNEGCVSRMALAFSNFSCSMALHNAEKWMSEPDELLLELDLVVILLSLCTCCFYLFLCVIRWETYLFFRAFISPKFHIFN